jgi:hypothetical protein
MKIDKLKEFISEKYPNIKILNNGDIKYQERVNFICKKHGNLNTRLDHFLKKGCIECKKEKKLDNQKSKFIKNSKIKHNNKYLYDKVNYINNKTNVIITCKKHGDFKQRPDNHLSGSGCTNCNYKLSTSDFIEKSNKIHNNKYLYDKTEYDGNRKYVTIRCKKHGYFNQIARIHLEGFGCSKCNESTGEKKISSVLEKNNIKFIKQYKFENCKNILKLPFDFYLPKYKICIEYNGIQHYEPVDFFGGEKSFEYRKKLDEIKYNYCKDNNINLIIISYKDNIEDIILKIINPNHYKSYYPY